MPPPKILRTWDNWEQGIGHVRDDGSPSLYTSDKILGLRGELRPAPAATQVTVAADPGHHYQYFFEEPVSAGQTPTFDAGSNDSSAAASPATLTWAHTVADQENRILVVCLFHHNSAIPYSVTYDGVGLTRLRYVQTTASSSIFYLTSPNV